MFDKLTKLAKLITKPTKLINITKNTSYWVARLSCAELGKAKPQLVLLFQDVLFSFYGYNDLEGEIHSTIWSTKTFLYNIREPRYKPIRRGYHIFYS